MDLYTPRHIAAFFGVSDQTIRNWSEEFADYLSPYATPGDGKSKRYTRDDTGVFSLIASRRGEGHDMARVHADLEAGERGDIILPSDEIRSIVSANTEVRLGVQITNLERQLASVTAERDELREEVEKTEALKDENIRLQTQNEGLEQRLEQITREVENYQKQIRDLAIELGIERGKQMKDND